MHLQWLVCPRTCPSAWNGNWVPERLRHLQWWLYARLLDKLCLRAQKCWHVWLPIRALAMHNILQLISSFLPKNDLAASVLIFNVASVLIIPSVLIFLTLTDLSFPTTYFSLT